MTLTSDSVDEATIPANEDDSIQQRSMLDEDPNDIIVNERNIMAEVILSVTIRKSYPSPFCFGSMLSIGIRFLEAQWTLDDAAIRLDRPEFPVLVRKFLYDQLNPNPVIPSSEMIEDVYPVIEGKIRIFNSAIATFYAPSDISGIAGMRREYIRATPSWRKGPARFDCVLINSEPNIDGACGFEVARVFLFFSFSYEGEEYPCTLIQWYSFVDTEPDEDVGCWVVEPDMLDIESPHVAVVHVDCIFHTAHLMPVTRTSQFVNCTITMHTSLDIFKLFYLNKFVDHHAFASL